MHQFYPQHQAQQQFYAQHQIMHQFYPQHHTQQQFYPQHQTQQQSYPHHQIMHQFYPQHQTQQQFSPQHETQQQSYPHHQTQQQSYPHHQTLQQFSPWYNQPYLPQPVIPSQPLSNPQSSFPASYAPDFYRPNLKKDPRAISEPELIHLLDKHTDVLKKFHAKNRQEQLPILIDVITDLIRVPKAILVPTVQNEFFSLLQSPFVDMLNQWSQFSSLSDDEYYIFRKVIQLIRQLIRAADDITLIPSWLTDSTLLEAISDCLIKIVTSEDILRDENNRTLFKYFARLIDAYLLYQEHINHHNQSDKDVLLQLLNPIILCLTSSQFVNTFLGLPGDATSMTTTEKFFLVQCPTFLTSYYGSRLTQTIDSLLSTMLPQYAQILEKLVLSVHHWKRPMMQAVDHLLQLINHGAHQSPSNAKLVSGHLSFIDDVLRLVNEPILYNNLHQKLSNPETILMNTAISCLVNMISDPSILAYVKQSQVTKVFLRLTTCPYEPLVFNVYDLLAYTTREEDIKAMPNPGRLLATIIESLKITLQQAPNDKSRNEQLLEILKGLVQHDQMKHEVMKQNALPFLLECMNKLTDRAHILLLETLWSLTFREEDALALRTNEKFLRTIQTISSNTKNEPLKKAADGIAWKLVREPAFLKKVAKQDAEKQIATKVVLETVVEEVQNSDGQKQLVTKIKPVITSAEERTFEYDIMISYCHADKELIYEIHRFLVDTGFKIWIDLDNMYGPAMNAMAEAVENSEFIIMCMSDSYKQSTYCQAEAEYAFNRKRRLIPLIVRPRYRPDGWLGFMIGSRIYVDFSKFDFGTACGKLITEISLQRKKPLAPKPVQLSNHQSPTKPTSNEQKQPDVVSPPPEKSASLHEHQLFQIHLKRKASSNFTRKPVNQWTESDALDFLCAHRFIHIMPLCDGMDGRALIKLYSMCLSRNSKTYALLDNELQATYKMKLPIGIYTRFISAMEQRLTMDRQVALQTKPAVLIPTTDNTVTTIARNYVPPSTRPAVMNNVLVPNLPYCDRRYDLVIISDAPGLKLLNAVTQCDLNLERMLSLLRRNSVRS